MASERLEDKPEDQTTTDADKKSRPLARAFVLDSNSEWVTVATGLAIATISADEQKLTVALHDDNDSNMVLFSTTFHREQDIVRQQGFGQEMITAELLII